jgi:hypothetical protein
MFERCVFSEALVTGACLSNEVMITFDAGQIDMAVGHCRALERSFRNWSVVVGPLF